jgi:cholesterol transport system auxiliary component
MRAIVPALLASLACACAAHRPMPIRYDLDESQIRPQSGPRFNTTIAISAIQAPSWLRTTALIYRLDYEASAYPRAYTQSQWIAPPTELLTLRLRQRVAAANDGFTLDRLPRDTAGYRLEVTLEDFTQEFPSPDQSLCAVTLSATVIDGSGMRVLAQKTFRAEQPAPSADAAGAVTGLVTAADADFQQMLGWLRTTVPTQQAAATMTADPTSP